MKITSRTAMCSLVAVVIAAAGTLTAEENAVENRGSLADRLDNIRGCFGTYNAAPRTKDGHVDADKLMADLVDLKVNTYNWLIWHGVNDWEDLQKFAPVARKNKIKLWVSLVPPSESPPKTRSYSEPFKLDYEKWAVEIAKLSVRESNIVAWSIDDFLHNTKEFTPERVAGLLKAAREINPKLAFVPCCYYRQMSAKTAAAYRDVLDGVLFPYRDESDKANLTDPDAVEKEVRDLRERMGPKMPIIIDVYATKHSQLGDSTPEYVRQVMEAGKKHADGVLIYCHQDRVSNAAKYNVLKEEFHKWAAAK